jgi:MoxR-like ATPase
MAGRTSTSTTSARRPKAGRRTAAPARRARRESRADTLSPTRSLGVFGWGELDEVVLAALALEAPVLLVGEHGTAKTMVVERLAGALGLAFRHYNASLINYDDLVGIPLPDEDAARLRFVSTPGAIWEAEFVLLDELSRCRPDLQNKLFPIVHERRVAGVGLPRLRHRWAAMNPPSPDDEDLLTGRTTYLGAEPLDPALTDRFPFVVRVPGWDELDKGERLQVVAPTGAPAAGLDLPTLVARCAERTHVLEGTLGSRAADWAVAVVDQLRAAGVHLSARRAATLRRNAVAVHAARIELGHDPADVEASVERALLASLPQTAEETPVAPLTLRAAHRQAWEISGLAADDVWRQVLEETDPVERVLLADRAGLADADLARLVTQALAAQVSEPRRIGLATAMFLRFRAERELTPAAWEPLVQLSRRVLEPRVTTAQVAPGPQLDEWRRLTRALSSRQDAVTPLERNFLLGGYPDLWQRCDWKTALAWFRDDLARFEAEARL